MNAAANFVRPIHPTLRHPRTGLPLQAVGLRKSGKPIWPIMGAAEGDEPTLEDWSTAFDGKTPAEIKTALDEASEKASKAGDDSPWADLFKDQKPEDVKKAYDESRKWETRAKGNKKAADQLAELAKLITGESGDEPDADKLKGDLTAAQREAQATKVENAVLKGAAKHSADATLLVDSRSFMAKVSDLDPAESDFASKVDDAIKKAVEENPALKGSTDDGKPPKPVRQQGKPSEGKQQGGVSAGAEMFKDRRKPASSTTS